MLSESTSLRGLQSPHGREYALAEEISPDLLLNCIAEMHLIRTIEEEIALLSEQGLVLTPIHLAIGQEAVSTGVSVSLKAGDKVFGGHRSHSHYISAGGCPRLLIHEILCRESGACGGRGGSMHLVDPNSCFAGSVPLVGATIPLAVGAALASKLRGDDNIAVAYFGDGACEEGVLHESLNFSSTQSLPVLFVVENNLYSSHMDIAQRQPDDRMARFAEAHKVSHASVDGNDISAVTSMAQSMINDIRENHRPAFIEAVTFRWRGHVGPDVNIDVGVRRSESEISAWKKLDPLARAEAAFIASGGSMERVEERKTFETQRVRAIIDQALDAPKPDPETLLSHTYA